MQPPSSGEQIGMATPEGWSQRGGLSLPIVVPARGDRLVFTKVGGDPKLTLSVRVGRSGRLLGALLSGAALLLLGVWVLSLARHPEPKAAINRQVPGLLMVVGLVSALIMTQTGCSMVGMALFAIGAVWWTFSRAAAVRRRRITG